MLTWKKFLVLFVCIAAVLTVYLIYVDKERKASVENYVINPKVNDIYKLQRDDREEGKVIYYLKIKDIGKESIYFYPGTLAAGNLHDGFLKHFDTSATVVFTRKDLIEIRDGKWNVFDKGYHKLIEVERK